MRERPMQVAAPSTISSASTDGLEPIDPSGDPMSTTSLAARAFTAAALAVGLAACGGTAPDAATPDSTAETQTFSYTGARGETVQLDSVPLRLVVDEGIASALIPLGIRPVGLWGVSPPEDSVILQGQDLAGIESVGQIFGELNVERIAALDPDLIITGYYPLEEQLAGIEPGDDAVVGNLEQIAPILTIDATRGADQYITDVAALAAALGADAETPEVAQARAEYEAAVAEFTAAVTARPGLTVTAVAPDDQLYIANPPDFSEFIDLTEWGLQMQVPDGIEPRGYFAAVSWEQVASRVTGDLVFLDARGGTTTEEVAAANPTWSIIPAVQAGAVVPWVTDSFTNYANYTRHLRTFTTAIEQADPDLVDAA